MSVAAPRINAQTMEVYDDVAGKWRKIEEVWTDPRLRWFGPEPICMPFQAPPKKELAAVGEPIEWRPGRSIS